MDIPLNGHDRAGHSRQVHTGQQQQQVQQQQQQQRGNGHNQPYIGWDLTLHPLALNKAYWRERAPRHSQWDYQVRTRQADTYCFLSMTVCARDCCQLRPNTPSDNCRQLT